MEEMLESDDGRIQYRCQFTGYKKVTDARWWWREEIETWKKGMELIEDWERRKATYGVTERKSKDGTTRGIRHTSSRNKEGATRFE